jgi:hypothetical protein
MESATQEAKGKLSRDFVDRSMLELHDEAVANKRWGHLGFVVVFKDGVAHQVKRYFEETLTTEK